MKLRLDAAIVERGLISGRDKAKGLIMAGQVYVNNQKADKPGQMVDSSDMIQVRGERLPYVSRGGLKLAKAIEVFGLSMTGMTCADIGASTGGFTDCMLEQGADKVYAIDVGYGQLAWKLRCDPRVINLERTNVRYITAEQVPELLDFFSVDVSFISLELVLPAVFPLLKNGCKAICLVKPQFEAGREYIGKKGVVRDPQIHQSVLEKTLGLVSRLGLRPLGLTFSPIKGPEGNIEYLLLIEKSLGLAMVSPEDVATIVAASHQSLDGNSVKERL